MLGSRAVKCVWDFLSRSLNKLGEDEPLSNIVFTLKEKQSTTVMEALEKQVQELHQQVETLRLAVERLPSQVVAEWSARVPQAEAPVPVPSHALNYGQSEEDVRGILVDEGLAADSSSRMTSGQEMAPEAQVQRLTAQLTAAYNRIAALEEQLLSQRLAK